MQDPIAINNEFIDACQAGDKERAMLCIDSGANINFLHGGGETGLHKCAREGHLELLLLLLGGGADPTIGNLSMNNDPFMVACFNRQTAVALALMDYGIDLRRRNNSNSSAFIFSVCCPRVLERMLMTSAAEDLDTQDDNLTTPLIQSTNIKRSIGDFQEEMVLDWEVGNTESMAMLLQAGAKPNLQNKYGRTALLSAAYAKSPAMVKLLLQHKADVSVRCAKGWDVWEYLYMDPENVDGAEERITSIAAMLSSASA